MPITPEAMTSGRSDPSSTSPKIPIGEVVDERQVDHAVGRLDPGTQAVRVVERPAVDHR
jgi:hypothetical protein